jgi:putative NADH-flavin reductase
MQVTVFGASGKVGRLVVEKLLSDGHTVIAFIHSSNPFAESDQLHIARGDVHNLLDVTPAMQGSDAVISTLGSWGVKNKDIVSSATRNIIPAMEGMGAQRLVSLTGSGAHAPGDHISLGDKLSHAIFGLFAKKIIVDAEQHLEMLATSSLDWTVVRAPIMNNKDSSKYHLDNKLPLAWETIPRRAVANALVGQLNAHNFNCKAPHIHNQ